MARLQHSFSLVHDFYVVERHRGEKITGAGPPRPSSVLKRVEITSELMDSLSNL